MSVNRFFLAPIASSTTVPEDYVPSENEAVSSDSIQLLQDFCSKLKALGYEQISISKEVSFFQNLRRQIERLNSYTFTDSEWKRFRVAIFNILNQKSNFRFQIVSGSPIKFTRENGSTRNIRLINRSNFSNNQIQILLHAEKNAGVSLLVNGLPMIYAELFPDSTALSTVFSTLPKINLSEYGEASLLWNFVQIFIVSNGKKTRYSSFSVRMARDFSRSLVWTDASGNPISNLFDFTRLFLNQNALQNILFNFQTCDWDGEMLLLRPYQIVASERILNHIIPFVTHKGAHFAPGGIIHHPSGSGKTLTAFRTAQLATSISGVEKVLFIVDRNDLDWKTFRFYEHFKKGTIDFSLDTQLIQQDINQQQTIFIPTTIQKLTAFLKSKRDFETIKKRTIFVYDECQRHLSPNLRSMISRVFVNSQHFFFTGALESDIPSGFAGSELHSYSLKQAISERTILPFHIQYIPTQKTIQFEGIPEIDALKVQRALIAPDRIQQIALTISGKLSSPSTPTSFNSILAVNDVILAMNYYVELRRIFKDSDKKIKIATIFSPAESGTEGQLQEERFEVSQLNRRQRDFLELVIEDYNSQFHTNLSSTQERFQDYFLDLSRRMQLGEIDLLIVVNRFLSSFSSGKLNTLWVDRDFTPEALLQAFARTNRLNAQKKAGNVICFRDLTHQVAKVLPPEAFV